MNSYPNWWTTTITIYNRFDDPQTRVVTWYRTVLQNCFWKYVGEKIKVDETIIETDNSICRIPANTNFREKHIWKNLPNDTMSDYFTLAVGDIIVKGQVTDTINEYSDGHRASDVIDKYKKLQGCMIIESMSINSGTGYGNEHYYVRGV